MSPHLKQILCGLICISTFALAGCGSSGPSEKQCATQLDQMFRGLFSAESLDLQKTGQEGNLSVYSVSGKFELNQNLFIPVAQIGDKTVLKRTTEKGLETPFSATLSARGTDNTGWVLSFSDLTFDRSQFKGSVADADIAHDPSHYLKVGDSDFGAQIAKINDGCMKIIQNAKKASVADADYEALKKDTQVKIQQLRDEKNKELSQAGSAYDKERNDYFHNILQPANNKWMQESFKKRTAQNNIYIQKERRLDNLKTYTNIHHKPARLENGTFVSGTQIDAMMKKLLEERKAKREELEASIQAARKPYEQRAQEAQKKFHDEHEKAVATIQEKFGQQIQALQDKLNKATNAREQASQTSARCDRIEEEITFLGLKGYLK
jgi:hypothetical protein